MLRESLRKIVAEIEASIERGDVVLMEVQCGVREDNPVDKTRVFAPTPERFLSVRYATQ